MELLVKKEFVFFIGEGMFKVLVEFGEIYFFSIYNLFVFVFYFFFYFVSKLFEEMVKKVGVIVLLVLGEI